MQIISVDVILFCVVCLVPAYSYCCRTEDGLFNISLKISKSYQKTFPQAGHEKGRKSERQQNLCQQIKFFKKIHKMLHFEK